MFNLDDWQFTIDEDGNVWAYSEREDWDASNFIWDISGQLIFDDIPRKMFQLGSDGKFHLRKTDEEVI